MRWRWLFSLLVSLWLCTSAAEAQAPWPTRAPQASPSKPRAARDPGAFARAAAIFGTVSAGILLGGSIAIAAVDDLPSERITRGVWLGVLTVSSPFVALGAYTARKRARVDGYKAVRLLGWTSWSFGLANGVLQWYEAFHGNSQPWGLTVGLGALGALATLPLAIDAFVSGRRASMRRYFHAVSLGPLAVRVQF
jgi:hypothetical protein